MLADARDRGQEGAARCCAAVQEALSSCWPSAGGAVGVEQESVGRAILESVLEGQLDATEDATAAADALSGVRDTRVAFFVGAGASVDSGLPNFRQFSGHMLRESLRKDVISEREIDVLVSELRPEVLLQTMHESYGDRIFEFYDWFDDARPSTNHFGLARALREGDLVLTTNIDTLIEEAYEELYGERDFDLVVSEAEFKKFSAAASRRRRRRRGALLKFHGTVDKTASGSARYDTVRFLLNQVGEGVSPAMHGVLSDVVRNFDMIFLGYSGCDNFSVQPVMCSTRTSKHALWFWYESNEKMVLESDHGVFEEELEKVGLQVAGGASFADIPRGLEILSTCEILVQRANAIRLRGNTSTVMKRALPGFVLVRDALAEGPVPAWTQQTPRADVLLCAAGLFAAAHQIDRAIGLLEDALRLLDNMGDVAGRARALHKLGNLYMLSSTASSNEKAIDMLRCAISLYMELEDAAGMLDAQLDCANVLRRTRAFDEALEALEEVVVPEEAADSRTLVVKTKARILMTRGLIYGLGRPGGKKPDETQLEGAIEDLEAAAELAKEAGLVSLHASVLNASGLVKYNTAGDSRRALQSAAKDLNEAFRLNQLIGSARACFQQLRNLGLVHVKLGRLEDSSAHLDQAISDFKNAERFLFRLSQSRVLGELLEVRFRLGEALVAAMRFREAEPVLLGVQARRIELGDWHNEARTLELLLQAGSSDDETVLQRARRVEAIYADVLRDESKRARFDKQPIVAVNARSILASAIKAVQAVDGPIDDLLRALEDLRARVPQAD